MKSLKKFILESLEDKEIPNLIVTYKIKDGEDVVIQAPETYSEDDLTLFLGDKWFNELPGGKNNKISKNLFGKSLEKIIDVHIEYDSFEHNKDYDGEVDVEWDNKYDTKNSDDSELHYFTLSNVKYLLQFESFNVKIEENDNINDVIEKIFKTTESSNMNKYPINITLDDNPFDYDEID